MMNTSYTVSKRLKEFFGADAPAPIGQICMSDKEGPGDAWLYTLEDILSRPFCAAVAEKYYFSKIHYSKDAKRPVIDNLSMYFWKAYYERGFPAVEKRLIGK